MNQCHMFPCGCQMCVAVSVSHVSRQVSGVCVAVPVSHVSRQVSGMCR